MRRLTREVVAKRVIDAGRGIQLLGDYKNNRTKTLFECSKGHRWKAVPETIMRGVGCPLCDGHAPLFNCNDEYLLTLLNDL